MKKAFHYPSPHRKILLGDGFAGLEPSHPLHGKAMIEDKPTAYICQVGSCSAPVTELDDLEEKLSGLPL